MSRKIKEMTERQQENKREDKKAISKFILIMIMAFGIGIGVGAGGAGLRLMFETSVIAEALRELLATAAVYGAYVYTTILLLVGFLLYKKSRNEYTAWDEENEEVLSGMETKLSYVMWFSNLIMLGSYFFLSVGIWATDLPELKEVLSKDDSKTWILMLLAVVLHIIYALIASCVMQQKAVNLIKEINPEKNGSVYDMKFRSKWLETCDEAERYETYKCAFQTFKVTQMVGIILWLVCIVGQILFDTGVFATIVISIFMLIQTSVYSVQSIYFAKHPGEVMK